MKSRLILASFICMAISGYSLTTTAADRTGVRSKVMSPDTLVQPDIPGLVVENLSQALAMNGLEVYRDGYTLTIITEEDQVVELAMPSTLDALKNGDFSLYENGMPSYLRGVEVASNRSMGGCFDLATSVLAAELDICINLTDDDFNAFCIVQATGNFALNVLKCLF